jgi:hypothetical protein
MRTSVLLALAASTLLGFGACSDEDPPPEDGEQAEEAPWNPADGLQPQEGASYAIESTLTFLDGEYLLENPDGNILSARFVFDNEGFYERTEVRVGGARRDSGSYLFDKSGHLLLYVERRGDSVLSTAVPAQIEAEIAGDSLLLTIDDEKLRFLKTPPVAPAPVAP